MDSSKPRDWPVVRVCLGGTFDPFHVGHEAMLRVAAQRAREMFVGVTEGGLAARHRQVAPVADRIVVVEGFLRESGYTGGLVVRPLTDAMGPAATGDYDAIVVSPETVRGAQAINDARTQRGLETLAPIIVPHVLGQDLLPVSGTRIAAGDIDRHGRRLQPVRVAVGSGNPVKVAAVEEELARLLDVPLDVRGQAASSGVPEQPKEGEILAGARQRALAAMKAWEGADYAIGVEAGLQRDEEDWFDVQAAVVLDAAGRETRGWGPAFQYPEWVTQRALAGEMVSDILGPVAQDPRIGGTTGAIGFLTDGRLERRELTRMAVLMAFVPRIRRELYDVGPGDASASG